MASESALISAEIPLLRVRAPPPVPWPEEGPESLYHLVMDWLYTHPKNSPILLNPLLSKIQISNRTSKTAVSIIVVVFCTVIGETKKDKML
ncbi:hypothetical protein PoB_007054100 [Plakobranchus ocellatus]|uniref:Uncharacterized protein n=1 Tax=Plakobranchus ocellatus TaxID=259542 RepID=A0AAV4DIQ8_9GAST|nr:hypothetical protein PoB_007054100 [Plakobranchus ocellatus]